MTPDTPKLLRPSTADLRPRPSERGRETAEIRLSSGSCRTIDVRWLGRVPYAEGLALQRELVEQRRVGRIPDVLLLLEHPHVLTLGVRAASRSHIVASPELLTARGVEVYETGRGGDVTYHGPGQIVGYPIVDLKPDRCDVHHYVRDLEEVMIRTAGAFGVPATRRPGLTGVWVGHRKAGAIGVRITRWITSHGFALNVTTDLEYFRLIVPCGLVDGEVTSLTVERGQPIRLAAVASELARHFCALFRRAPAGASE